VKGRGDLGRAPSRSHKDSLLGNGCSMRGIRPYNDTERSKGKPTLTIPSGARILHKEPKVRPQDNLSLMTGSRLQRAYTWLEPDEGKLSCSVLRGGRSGNASSLPERVRVIIGQDPLGGHLFQ
jgi:hypothetical protein